MNGAILSINAGSSSIKFGLFDIAGDRLDRAASGKLEKIGIAPRLEVRRSDGEAIATREWHDGAALTHEALLEDLFAWAKDHLPHKTIAAVGHRVVHGGTRFTTPVLVDSDTITELQQLCPLAPLHQPHNIAAICAIGGLAPNLPQIACFDTAFHAGMPEVATRLPLPRKLAEQGIRRYGFHGLSYEYIAQRLKEHDPQLANGRMIVAHLGNGASMCAMRDGQSVDTTMGFTALDGLVMGTRSGALDPGVLLHLEQQLGMTANKTEHLLYCDSGLLGISGISSDMRTLRSSKAPNAREAIESFVWSAARQAAGLCASLGGLDALVFTAGIGENDPMTRHAIIERLEWLGIVLDDEANERNARTISKPDSPVKVLVIPTDEESMIAQHTLRLARTAR